MSKEKEVKSEQKYSKSAFVEVAADSKERLILQVVLEDGESYTKADAEKKVKDWKSKKINGEKEKGVKA